ncbi:24180_t:CDS:2, partial [Cetraspora pellucida]
MAPGKAHKQNTEAQEPVDEAEACRSDVCRSHMSVETLKNLCSQLNLSTEGNKADLIERLTCVGDMTQLLLGHLRESGENIEGGVFEDTQDEDEAMQGDMFQEECPSFDRSLQPLGEEESRVKRTKKAGKEFKDTSDIKTLLREIKHLREDVNIISGRIESSKVRAEIHKNWPDIKFERSRDQFEYNVLCAIGHDLDLALSASTEDKAIQHIEDARVKTLDRTEVAVELPQSKNEGLSIYGETIERVRQVANIKQQSKRKYSSEGRFFRGSEFYDNSRSKHGRQEPYYSEGGKIGPIWQKEKEIMPSHATTVMDWGTMQIIVPQDRTDAHLEERQANLRRHRDILHKAETQANYSRAPMNSRGFNAPYKIQLMMALSNHRSRRLFYSKLERRNKLCLCTFRPIGLCVSSCNGMSSNNNNYRTNLDFSSLVADYVASPTSGDSTSKFRRNFPSKPKWINRAIEQPKLEVYGNTNDFLNGLLVQAHNVLLPRSSYDHKLKAIWGDFIDFCNAYKLVALPASQESLLAYLIWSDIRGRTLKPSLVLTAISNQHNAQNLPDPTKCYK